MVTTIQLWYFIKITEHSTLHKINGFHLYPLLFITNDILRKRVSISKYTYSRLITYFILKSRSILSLKLFKSSSSSISSASKSLLDVSSLHSSSSSAIAESIEKKSLPA